MGLSLYEFLRTWRQRAKELIRLGEHCQTPKESEWKVFLKSAIAKADKRERLNHAAPKFYTDQVSRIGDAPFIAALTTTSIRRMGCFAGPRR